MLTFKPLTATLQLDLVSVFFFKGFPMPVDIIVYFCQSTVLYSFHTLTTLDSKSCVLAEFCPVDPIDRPQTICIAAPFFIIITIYEIRRHFSDASDCVAFKGQNDIAGLYIFEYLSKSIESSLTSITDSRKISLDVFFF